MIHFSACLIITTSWAIICWYSFARVSYISCEMYPDCIAIYSQTLSRQSITPRPALFAPHPVAPSPSRPVAPSPSRSITQSLLTQSLLTQSLLAQSLLAQSLPLSIAPSLYRSPPFLLVPWSGHRFMINSLIWIMPSRSAEKTRITTIMTQRTKFAPHDTANREAIKAPMMFPMA